MDPFNLIIVLTLVGFLFLAAEVFVPGMVLGLLGGLSLLGAVAISYVELGPVTGTVVLFSIGAIILTGFVAWMFLFPSTPIGRRIMLKNTLQPGAQLPAQKPGALLGKSGEAITTLRPAGTARIDGKRVDVLARGDFIEAGSPVTVVAHEGPKVVVRETQSTQTTAPA